MCISNVWRTACDAGNAIGKTRHEIETDVRLMTQLEDLPLLRGSVDRLFNLSVGRYDVTVQTGPAYATQREETRAALLELVQGDPEAKLVLGDLILIAVLVLQIWHMWAR